VGSNAGKVTIQYGMSAKIPTDSYDETLALTEVASHLCARVLSQTLNMYTEPHFPGH